MLFRSVVSAVYTDLAVIDVTGEGLVVRELIGDMEFDELQGLTGAPLGLADGWRPLTAPDLD